jgi:flagellar basal-body rod protein FlgB
MSAAGLRVHQVIGAGPSGLNRAAAVLGPRAPDWNDMPEITDAALVASLRRQMTIAVARQVAAAGNLANVDTPNYKAVEPTFADALDSQLSADDVRMQEVAGLQPRLDGNTVQLDRELLAMGRAAGDFSAAQTALAAKFRLIRYAINEGK